MGLRRPFIKGRIRIDILLQNYLSGQNNRFLIKILGKLSLRNTLLKNEGNMDNTVRMSPVRKRLFHKIWSNLQNSYKKISFQSKIVINRHLSVLFYNLNNPIHKLEQVGASTLNPMTHRNVESSFDITICAF